MRNFFIWIDADKTAREAREQIPVSKQVRWSGKFKSKKEVKESEG